MKEKQPNEELMRRKIFDAAMEMLEEVGYDGVTIRALCAKLNISTGKFYYYFRSKNEIFSFYFEKATQEFQTHVRTKDWDSMDIKEQIVNYYTWYTEYTASFGLDFAIHFFSNENQAFNLANSYISVVALTEEFLQRAVQNGYVIPDNRTIRALALDLCVIVKGCIFNWCVQRGSFSLPEYTHDLLSRCVRGLM